MATDIESLYADDPHKAEQLEIQLADQIWNDQQSRRNSLDRIPDVVDYAEHFPHNPLRAEQAERYDAEAIYNQMRRESINVNATKNPTLREIRLYNAIGESLVDPNKPHLHLEQKIAMLGAIGYRRLEGSKFEEVKEIELGRAFRDIYNKVDNHLKKRIVDIRSDPYGGVDVRSTYQNS